jgi:FAD/FMN-containing dehydrogenase
MKNKIKALLTITAIFSFNGYGWQWPTLKSLSSWIIPKTTIVDKLGLTRTPVNTIIAPKSVQELQIIVKNSTTPLSIAGGRYSQGGQIAYPDGIAIDMKQINRILDLNLTDKTITVEAGASWHKIQQSIDPHNLSVQVM